MNNPEKITDIVDDIKKWCRETDSLKLPKWDDLPEIDLYMDQVIMLMYKYLCAFMPDIDKQLTASMINNYVKMEVMPPPQKKKYSKTHLAYLIILCLLKQSLSISEISELIKSRLKTDTIENIYFRFTTKYVETFVNAIEKVSAKIDDKSENICDENTELRLINDIVIDNAVNSSAGRLIVANVLRLNMETDS